MTMPPPALRTRRFKLRPQGIEGVMLVERERLEDERGYFSRLFCEDELQASGWPGPVAQINHSLTLKRGTVRGMHYQYPPHLEAKIVTCLRGVAWDVALDLRAGSPTFLRWCAVELSPENRLSLLVPAGCAHGFQALTDEVELVYCTSTPYVADADSGVNPLDPVVSIDWPLAVSVLSDKDRLRPMIGPAFGGLVG
jgi:dTDP-4-dehydrorhamnose 3,5-epimerase